MIKSLTAIKTTCNYHSNRHPPGIYNSQSDLQTLAKSWRKILTGIANISRKEAYIVRINCRNTVTASEQPLHADVS